MSNNTTKTRSKPTKNEPNTPVNPMSLPKHLEHINQMAAGIDIADIRAKFLITL